MPLYKFALAMAGVSVLVSAQSKTQSFAPLEQWTSAVNSGDRTALANLYAPNPTLFLGNNRIPDPGQELQFWANLKSAGVTDIKPKVLEMSRAGQEMHLVLRVYAVRTGGQDLVASMNQIWVSQGGEWKLAASRRSDFQADQGRRLPEPAKPNPNLYPAPADAGRELKSALTAAAREHKRVLVIFGANWCYDCHVLDATFRSPQFAPLIQRNYVVIHINIGDEGKDNNDLASRFGVNLDKGIPALAVLNPDGNVVVAQQNGEFESTTKIGPNDVRAFLEKWKA
jgi:thioredoxin 1